MTAHDPTHQVSPEATGGAGTIEEYELGAVALAALLTGGLVPGLATPITSVALQRRVAGNALDDLVLRSKTGNADNEIDYQVKRTASPTASDAAFVDALVQAIEALHRQPEAVADGSLRLGFAASGPSSPLSQLRRLAEIARSHASGSTFRGVVVPGATRREVRGRYEHFRRAVALATHRRGETLTDDELDDLAFDILRHLHVWIFEVGDDGRDVLEATSRLALLVPPEGPDAHAVFSELRRLAETWGPNAGVIDAPMLRSALTARGIPLTTDPRHRTELDRVLEASRQELARTVDQIGGRLRLERPGPARELRDAIQAGGIVLVSGAAGAGKSVLARRAVQDLGDGATVVAISLSTRAVDTLATVQQELGVAHLATVLAAAPTTGPRVLLIDGAENALTDAGRLLESLLDAAPTGGSNSPPWTVVITSRSDTAGPLTERLGPRLSNRLELDDLSTSEIGEVSHAFPELASLMRNPRSKRLLGRPYLADLMVRSQASPREGEVLGEEDVMAIVHEKVVRRSGGLAPGMGSPHDRAVAWSKLAEAVVAGSGSSRLTDADGSAVDGLVSDDVFRRTTAAYRFAHDVMADYAVAMRLGDDDGPAMLENATAPRSLIRAVRLSIQQQLAMVSHDPDEVRRAWAKALLLATNWSIRDGSRWEDVPYEALVSLGDPGPVMEALTPDFLRGDAAGLGRLLAVTGRYATTPQQQPDGEALLLDSVLSAPVVALLCSLSDRVPARLTGMATQLVRRWLVSLEVDGGRASTFVTDPSLLSAAVAGWAGDDQYGELYEAALAVAGLLGGHPSAESAALLDRARQRADDLDVVVEDPDVAAALSRDNPELMLGLAGSYYLDLPLTLDPSTPGRRPARSADRRRGRFRTGLSGYEDEEGVREHSHRVSRRMGFGLAGSEFGPFAALLARSPTHGLRLVGAVVDAASDARIRIEESFGNPPGQVELPLKLPHWAEAVTYSGPGTAWGWYRRSGNGAYPAMSALMALRSWAKVQLETRPIASVLDDVLSAGDSVAFAAVAYSLVVLDLAAAGDLTDAFLEHPAVWDLEAGRIIGEGGPFGATDDHDALRVRPEQIAMWLALTGDDARRATLRAVGDRFLARSQEALRNPDDDEELLVARRRALFFDADSYRAVSSADQPGVVEISVDVPADVQEQLESRGGRAATLSLSLASAMFAAQKIRDGETTEPPAAQLYSQVHQLLQSIAETPGADPVYSVDDARAVVAAAVVVQAAAGGSDAKELLPEAVLLLMRVAVETVPEEESYTSGREMRWDMGADRSAATALPLILRDDRLRAASGVGRPELVAAVERLATSTSREVHERLTTRLAPVWQEACVDDEVQRANHATALAVYRELLLSAGIGPWNGHTRPRLRLTEPLEAALREPDQTLDLARAADALPGLKAASACPCESGQEALALLEVLIDYELHAWPAEWARNLYRGSEVWRSELDAWVAAQILAGDDGVLERYLDGFANVPEELRGLLTALSSLAGSPEQGKRLFEVWPTILDRLLPGGRHIPGPDDEPPHRRDEVDLDRALLPKRPGTAPWPPERFGQVLLRWMEAFAPRPDLCDRLMECLAPFGHAVSPTGVGLLLRMLGGDVGRILRDSTYVTGWLRIVLVERPDGLEMHQAALRQLVDDLAARGSTPAIQIQRELEA